MTLARFAGGEKPASDTPPPASGIDRYVRRQNLSRQVQKSAACDICAFP